MVATLWTSRKAMNVSQTELSLSSADGGGDQQFSSSMFSRALVRAAVSTSRFFDRVTPEPVKNFVAKRFEWADIEHSGAPYDMIRSTVNLTTASLLIALGTSLKLPLSTTYVCFMVAMGSSLADKAWGRESAVYRITGVMTVVMGWFVTGIGAFLIAIVVGAILMWGGTIAFIVTTIACMWMLIKSNFINSHKATAMPEEATEEDSIERVIDEVCKMMKLSTNIYDRTMVAVLKEDRKALKELVRESTECYEHTNKLKYSIMPALRKMKSSSVEVSLYYVQVVDYLSEITKAILHITRPAFEHIDNNHKGLSQEQVDDLMRINDAVAEIYGMINRMLVANDFRDIDDVLTLRDELFEHIAETTKSELQRITAGEGNTKASMFYLTAMSETKTMVLQARNLLKSQRYFLEHAGVSKPKYNM